jgi:hypothetical protein
MEQKVRLGPRHIISTTRVSCPKQVERKSKMTLTGDQYPKGLNEEEVRKIAREEAVNALGILKNAIADTPERADGNINARDLHDTLEIVENKLTPKKEAPVE